MLFIVKTLNKGRTQIKEFVFTEPQIESVKEHKKYIEWSKFEGIKVSLYVPFRDVNGLLQSSCEMEQLWLYPYWKLQDFKIL